MRHGQRSSILNMDYSLSFPTVRKKASTIKEQIRKRAEKLQRYASADPAEFPHNGQSAIFDGSFVPCKELDSPFKKLINSQIAPAHTRQLECFANQYKIRDVLPPKQYVNEKEASGNMKDDSSKDDKDIPDGGRDEFDMLSVASNEDFEIRDDGSVLLRGHSFDTSTSTSQSLPPINSSSGSQQSSLSKSECDKYFGINSKMDYYKTYRNLDRRSKIMDISPDDNDTWGMAELKHPVGFNDADSLSAMSSSIIDIQDDYFDKDELLDLCPSSPRSIYLAKVIKMDTSPTNPYYRSQLTTTLNLNGRGLGDDRARSIASCLSSLPFLKTLNIADNGIAGATLAGIFKNLKQNKNNSIESVDVSSNHMNNISAEAIASLLSCDDCNLRKLYIRKTNCDDSMSLKIMQSLLSNSSVCDIDLSENKIGMDIPFEVSKITIVDAALDEKYGSSSSSSSSSSSLSSLSSSRIPPLSLNLSWNLIKQTSYNLQVLEQLCQYMCLKSLNLSLNNLGVEGGKRISAIILHCHALTDVILENCGLDSAAIFTICCSARENKNIVYVNVNNNCIGEQGARCCARLSCHYGDRIKISASECCLKGHSKHSVYKIDCPCADYDLDLKSIYSRAIFMDILFLISVNTRYYIQSCSESLDQRSWNTVEVNERYSVPLEGWAQVQLREKEECHQINTIIFEEHHKKRLIEASEKTSQPTLMIFYGCQNFALRLHDAIWLEAKLYEDVPGRDRLRSFSLVIPLLVTDNDAQEFVEYCSKQHRIPMEALKASAPRFVNT